MGFFQRMLGKWERKRLLKEVERSLKSLEALCGMDIADIWTLDKESDFLVAMQGWLFRKSGEEEHPEWLSPAERTFFAAQSFINEVNNGGFPQFLDNSSGQFAGEIEDALRAVGATRAAEICGEMLGYIGGPIPTDWAVRRAWLDDQADAWEENSSVLNELEDQLMEEMDALEDLSYQWVMDHREEFS